MGDLAFTLPEWSTCLYICERFFSARDKTVQTLGLLTTEVALELIHETKLTVRLGNFLKKILRN